MLTLVTGGIRRGKSKYGLELAAQQAGSKCFLATAQALDNEMKIRIQNHRKERSTEFATCEEPLYLANALQNLQSQYDLILIDCLNMWLSNLLMEHIGKKEENITRQIEWFLQMVKEKKTSMIFITNEVGMALVPDNATGRWFVEELGRLNQRVAEICDEVIFMTCGIPNPIKGHIHDEMDV